MILRLPKTDEAASLEFLAWLAFPGASEAHRRDAFIKAAAFYVHYRMEIRPRNMPSPLRGIKPSRAVKTIESAWSQIVHRRVASVYVWLRMHEQRFAAPRETGLDGFLRDFNGVKSIEGGSAIWADTLSQRVKEDDDKSKKMFSPRSADAGDFRKRTWRPSQPVMPMAVAFCFSRGSIAALTNRLTSEGDIGDVGMDGPLSLGLTNCITNPSWVREAAQVAQSVSDERDPEIIFPNF
ncbi:MAG: hypothetical protein R6V26_13895 [Roseovarius sp.]